MISIIIPVHNSEKTILRALESVAQQHVHKELIVIDDFCTDKTMDIVEKFDSTCNFKVRMFRTDELRRDRKKPTGAPNIPRNLGVSIAQGEYIALLDADDWWAPTKLIEQEIAILKYKADVCTTSFLAINEITKTQRLHGKNTGLAVFSDNVFERFLKRDKSKQTLMSTMLFKKNIFPQMDEIFGVTDYLWTARLLEGHKVVVIEKPLMYRAVYGTNTSYGSLWREMQVNEQVMTIIYYANKYGYDLDLSKRSTWGSYARYLYQQGRYKEARRHFLLAPRCKKVTAYYTTSFFPPLSRWVSRKFNVWGDN